MPVRSTSALSDVRAEVGGVHAGERAAALADRGADGVDDVGLGRQSCRDPVEQDGEVLVGDLGRGVSSPPGRYQRTATQTVSRMKR